MVYQEFTGKQTKRHTKIIHYSLFDDGRMLRCRYDKTKGKRADRRNA